MNHLLDVKLATLAYPKNRAKLWHFFPEGMSLVELDHSNAQLVAAANEDMVTIAIAGTNEFVDWGFNANLETEQVTLPCENLWSVPSIGVHKGIWEYAKLAAYAIERSGVTSGRKVRVTGHSLGGAAALLLPLLMPGIVSVTTFGAPRCLRSDSAFRYPSGVDVTRYVRPLDIVPDLPLAFGWGLTQLSGWSHIGDAKYLFNSGAIKTELTTWDQLRRRCVRLLHWINDGFMTSILAEHNSSDGYLRLLENS